MYASCFACCLYAFEILKSAPKIDDIPIIGVYSTRRKIEY